MHLILSFLTAFVLCVNFSMADSSTEREYRIKHARADLEYYKARKKTIEVVLEKVKTKLELDLRILARRERLVETGTVVEEELDEAKHGVEQDRHNIKMMESRLAEADAEIKQAEARVGIAETSKEIPNIKLMRNRRHGRRYWRNDHEKFEYYLAWELFNFPMPDEELHMHPHRRLSVRA